MEPVLRVHKLVQKYGRRTIFSDVSFTLQPGEFFGVFGLRGAGKTALLHILAGIDRFKSGDVDILGYNIAKSEEYKRYIGLVTQQKSLFTDLNLIENLDFISALKKGNKADIYAMIERFNLAEWLKKPVTALPEGIYQRLSLACAMLNKPKLLFADSLFTDYDLYSRRLITKELKNFQTAEGACIYSISDLNQLQTSMAEFHTGHIGWLQDGLFNVYSVDEAISLWDKLAKDSSEPSDMHHV